MNQPKKKDRYCIAQQSSGHINKDSEFSEPIECEVLISLDKHLKCDSSSKQANMLTESMLQSICEVAGLNCLKEESALSCPDDAAKSVTDRINELDLEIQMLNLRKRALVRRIKTLEKLAWHLDEEKNAA